MPGPARKRFGQHFLHDRNVISRIIAAIAPQPEERVVEIGPGYGAITLPLLALTKQLDAIEIDWDAARELERVAQGCGELRLHRTDVLEFNFAQLRGNGCKLRAVGNLPYNISTPLIFRLIEQREHFSDMHFMLQKEVVDRMAAAPGSKHYGRLSVTLAPWLSIEPLFDIGSGAFRPPPKVTSTFVRLRPHDIPPFELRHPAAYARIVAQAFSQRRKMLGNALRPLLQPDEIARLDISPQARAEVLTPGQFARLATYAATRSTVIE